MILQGKTVIVIGVGVGSGLGRECAASALRDGANVVVAARTADVLEATASELDPSGDRIAAVVTDITDADSCQALVDATLDRFGTVDALVQVAAYENVWGGLYELRFDAWRKAFETNVLGALTAIRPAATAMKANGGGSIVLVGSQSMFQPALPQSGYAASKGALLSAMYYLAEITGSFPLRRMTEDGEVADQVAFFASDHAKAVTGQHLMVNSGEMMR
jgi:NAD(P)-dependent dehydrogenase (short-subunit alcohol dehydrogenase family)